MPIEHLYIARVTDGLILVQETKELHANFAKKHPSKTPSFLSLTLPTGGVHGAEF